MLRTFSQNLTLQEAFESAAQIKEELKLTEFDSLRLKFTEGHGFKSHLGLRFFPSSPYI